MTREELKSKIFIGTVEDNEDPKKLGRCRVRVLNIFDSIPKEDLPWATPWKDLNGNQFILPEVGKVVSVVFDEGNPYKPEYIFAEHYNINLERKLSELSGKDYTSMRALMFDHKTQIYSNDGEGLKIDYKLNNINITKNDINLNLKDNFSHVNIGTPTANQKAILGDHFMDWFDEFVDNLLGPASGQDRYSLSPFIGNAGAPVQVSPALLELLNRYKALRDVKFLSHHVNLVDNEFVQKQERPADGQLGDSWKSTVGPNQTITSESVDFQSKDGNSSDTPDGQLTPYVDESGNVLNPLEGNVPPPDVTPSTNIDVNKILDLMKRKGYVINTKPFEVNIVGIRRQYEGMKYSNAFKDDLYVIYRDNAGSWRSSKYKITTMPGFYSAQVVDGKLRRDPTGKSPNVKQSSIMLGRGTPPNNGMGILMEAQYLNIYTIGEHCGEPAMKTTGPQKFYRDNSPGDIIKYTGSGTAWVGMLIHRGYPGGSSVNNWSEGCQVFSSEAELNSFFRICREHQKRYGNKFHYTLMLERDL